MTTETQRITNLRLALIDLIGVGADYERDIREVVSDIKEKAYMLRHGKEGEFDKDFRAMNVLIEDFRNDDNWNTTFPASDE